MSPAIVIVTHSRVNSLRRLLHSLSDLHVNERFDLVVSIDDSEVVDQVIRVANNYSWEHGEKKIKHRKPNMGLFSHIMTIGDLTEEYEFIVVLEDDLTVSPHFLSFSRKAFDFHKNESKVFGVSLYSPILNETTLGPFLPIKSDDNYFMQLPCSWGQVWYKEQWRGFKEWMAGGASNHIDLPTNVYRWSTKSWKKQQLKYLISSNKFYVYPYESYTTNYGDAGEHVAGSSLFQVQFVRKWRPPIFSSFESCLWKYDAWCELCSIESDAIPHDILFDIDVNGTKSHYRHDYVLTTKSSTNAIISFSCGRFPIELNVIHGELDNEKGWLVLSHVVNVKDSLRNRIKYYGRIFNVKLSLSFLYRILFSRGG